MREIEITDPEKKWSCAYKHSSQSVYSFIDLIMLLKDLVLKICIIIDKCSTVSINLLHC